MNAAQTIIEPQSPGASAAAPTILESTPALTGLPRPLTARDLPAAGAATLVLTPGAKFGEWLLSRPLHVTSAEADLWMLAHSRTRESAVLKLFRYGIRPKADIQSAVQRLKHSSVVTVFATGEVDGRIYEIQEFIQHGSLAQFFPAGPAPLDALRAVLAELTEALADVHAADIIHRDLKPANILVRSREPLDLVLADFGISSLSDLSLHMSNANRTAAYAAPEAMTGVVARGSDWWSVGVMLLEMLTGQHPFAGLDERTVNFILVTRGIEVPAELPSDWAQLIRGLLTRDHAKRWGQSQVAAWLVGERDIPLHYGLEPGGDGAFRPEPYKFGAREYSNPRQLALALVDNWDDAVRRLLRGSLTEWASKSLRDANLTRHLEAITADRRLDSDQKLAAALLALDPDLPLVLRGAVVTPEWLAAHATMQRKPVPASAHTEAKENGTDDLEPIRRAIEIIRADQHASPMQLQRRLGVSHDDALRMLDELGSRHLIGPRTAVAAREVLVGPDEGLAISVGVIESSLPKWFEELRGEHWLAQAAARHRATWDFLADNSLRVSRTIADQIILSPYENAVWPLVEERRQQFARSRHPGFQALFAKAEPLTWPEAVALVAADPALFETPAQMLVTDSLAWLERLGIRCDRAQTTRLVLARDWHAVLPDWQKRRARFIAATPAPLHAMLKKDDPEYLEAIAIVVAETTHFETRQQVWLSESARWLGRLDKLRRDILHPSLPWFALSLSALGTLLTQRRERLASARRELDEFFARLTEAFQNADAATDNPDENHSAETRRRELLAAILQIEEELEKTFTTARRRAVVMVSVLVLAVLAVLGVWAFKW